jgi:3,4-dihydroxy 2-butanone 4-phosphate synthase/GTP cyclohydrolase II
MVILVDEEDRENEGDLVLASDHVTPEAINFMAKFGRGLICLTLTRDRCEQLQLPPMVVRNGTKHGTAFTVSIEATEGVTTGISAADRARTVQAAVARHAKPTDLVQPGHIFPLQAQDGGVLMRAGHTEAGCDLAAMAGLTPSSVICEIMNDDGTMARLPDLEVFAKEHGLKIGTIADLIQDRTGALHLALSLGQWSRDDEVLVRVHEPFSVLDWLDAGSRSHSWPLPKALATVREAGRGVIVLLNVGDDPERLGDRLLPVGQAVPPKPPADLRTYGVGAQILRSLAVQRMRLMGNQQRLPSMVGFGLEVTGFLTADGQSLAPSP